MSAILETMGIDRLTYSERLSLVHEIWDSLADDIEREPVNDAMKSEIDRRLARYETNPESTVSWEQVEAEALARLGQ